MDELAGAAVTLVPIEAGMKTCSKCRESKPLDQFNAARKAADGKQRYCRACQSDHAKRYAKTHAQRNRDNALRYHYANREAVLRKMRDGYERNKHLRIEAVRQWRLANPERKRALEYARRARKACAVPQRWQVHDVLPFACYWCGSNLRAYGATSHVDHVMPISLGGPAVPSNEVMTCATCNLRKGAKHPLVWLAELTA